MRWMEYCTEVKILGPIAFSVAGECCLTLARSSSLIGGKHRPKLAEYTYSEFGQD
jgi:hypothetical protein